MPRASVIGSPEKRQALCVERPRDEVLVLPEKEIARRDIDRVGIRAQNQFALTRAEKTDPDLAFELVGDAVEAPREIEVVASVRKELRGDV